LAPLLVLAWICALAGCGPPPESRRLIERLNAGSLADRLRAVAVAQAHADEHVRRELLRLFEDVHQPPPLRGAAGGVLGAVHDRRVVASAIRQLPGAIVASTSGPARAREQDPHLLGRALTAYGPEALPAVTALLRDSRREVVTWAIMHHGSYRQSDAALEVLGRYLSDKDVIYRRSAAFGLSLMNHARGEDTALRHLSDPDTEVRYNLAWALLNSGSARSIQALEARMAVEKDVVVRDEIGKALGVIRRRQPSPGVPTHAGAAGAAGAPVAGTGSRP